MAIVCILGFIVSRGWAERAHFVRQAGAKPWDRVLAPLAVLAVTMIPLVAGLDARFGWSPAFHPRLRIVALAVLLASYAFATYAMIENPFFSSVVRIQTEHSHRVVSRGPYRWVRHPGHAGSFGACPIV